jgi:hypothetical protein
VPTNRFVLGAEKTIFQQAASLEVRLPLASAQAPDVTLESDTDATYGSVGNAFLGLKVLLYQTDALQLSAGLGLTFPTGPNSTLTSTVLQERLSVENDTLALQPFLAAAWAPTERWFVQGFTAWNLPVLGNSIGAAVLGQGLVPVGALRDPSLWHFDLQTGYWVYRTSAPDRWVTAAAPFLELQGTFTPGDLTRVTNTGFSAQAERSDAVDLTLGLDVDLGRHSNLLLGLTLPLWAHEQRIYNFGFSLVFEYHFEYLTRRLHSPNF